VTITDARSGRGRIARIVRLLAALVLGAVALPATVLAQADVSVTKIGPAQAQGDRVGIINYLIVTTNQGPAQALNVVVTDSLPVASDIRFLSASRSAARTGRLLTWPAVTLASGQTIVDTVTVRVDGRPGGVLVNVAYATSSTADPNAGNNRSEVQTLITAGPVSDLAVSKTGPASAMLGDTIVYVVTTRNLGSADAAGVVVSDTMPVGVQFVRASRSGSAVGRVVTWPAMALANGAAVIDTVVVVATGAGAQTDVAAATTTSTDPNPANNDGSNAGARVTTSVYASADVSVTKTDGRTQVGQGAVFAYTVVVSNAGPDPVTGVTLTDVFPAGFTSVTWTCTPAGGAVCNVVSGSGNIAGVTVDLPAGGTATFIATGTASGTGTLVNTATITSPAWVVDPVPGNDSATDGDTEIVILSVVVTPDGLDTLRHLPSNGTGYVYAFTVTNTSAVPWAFDLFAYPAGGGTSFVSVDSITGAAVSGSAVPDSARIASLAAGASAGVSVWYAVADVAAGSLDTLRLRSYPAAVPAVADSGFAVVRVVRPAITTAKSVNPSGVQAPGTELTYTVTVTNAGSEAAESVVTVDSLPAEVEFRVGSVATTLPPGVGGTVEFSTDGADWTYSPASGGCGAPAGFDGCVTRIRWTLTDPLSAVTPDNVGSLQFVARIR
jgi:uncharacterized repeat protein (TIGR01451 family)